MSLMHTRVLLLSFHFLPSRTYIASNHASMSLDLVAFNDEQHNYQEPSASSSNSEQQAPPSSSRFFRKASLRIKLTLFIGLLVILASGIPSLVILLKAHNEIEAEIRHRLTTVSLLRGEQLRDYLYSQTQKSDLISTRIQIVNYLAGSSNDSKAIAEYDLNSAIDAIRDFRHAGIYRANGAFNFATQESEFVNSIQRENLQSLKSNSTEIGFPLVHSRIGWTYNLTKGIFWNGTMVGVVVAWVNATQLEHLIYGKTGLQETGELLVGVPGRSSKIRLLLPARLEPSVTEIPLTDAMRLAFEGKAGITSERDYRGVKVIVAYAPVGFLNWGLLAKLETHEVYAPVRSFEFVIVVTIITIVLGGLAASFSVAKIFTAPIIELGKAAAALGEGNMRSRVNTRGVLLRDEIADLQDTFNSMAEQIAKYNFILEQLVAERTRDLAQANKDLGIEIEERKRMDIELEKAKNIAIEANKSKSEFLANMSHELRTPLNAIINFTELCLDTEMTHEQEEHLDYVRFAAQHLLRLVTDILDFSKIEAGKLEMEEIQFSLIDQLEHSVSVLASRALKSGLELCCSLRQDVPDEVIGDPGRLLQILVNLIGNGIKFTKTGEVVVSVSVREKKSDTSIELLFSVKDTGKGIPKAKQALLFQAFSQVDSSTQRIYGGTGLGLVISSKLAKAMGGRMWMDSDGTDGQGSTFFFTAVFQIPQVYNPSFIPNMDVLKNVHVLVVEDNDTNQEILVGLLKSWRMLADGVNTIEAAMCVLEKAAGSGQSYKIVLLDMWLSGRDSSELLHFIRERFQTPTTIDARSMVTAKSEFTPTNKYDLKVLCSTSFESDSLAVRVNPEFPISLRIVDDGYIEHDESTCPPSNQMHMHPDQVKCTYGLGKSNQNQVSAAMQHRVSRKWTHEWSTLPVVVMLTSVDHTDTIRCKELGVSIHTAKPIKRALLARALEAALGIPDIPNTSEAKVSKGLQTTSVKTLHILVAEDNLVNQRVAMLLLQKWGHTAVLACNGAEAVDKYMKEKFDLILMDVQMPVCDGLEATAKIRDYERLTGEHRTIVAMTAHAMSGDGARCLSAGMDYYITKPLNSKNLQELLNLVAIGLVREASVSPSNVED